MTAFLWNGSRVLLAQRSQAVSTFPGHWAGISGYIEHESPLERALIEIEEETGIPRTDVVLRGQGEPFVVGQGRCFRVHPFLFSVAPDCSPRHDWEAQRFEWVSVDDLLADRLQPTVPKLSEGFRRVWPPCDWQTALARNSELAVRWLQADRRHGAGWLARSAARHWLSLARIVPDDRFAEAIDPLRRLAQQLAAARPAMAAPANMMDDVAERLAASADRSQVVVEVEQLIRSAQQAEQQAAQQAAQRLPADATVITISFSGTVCDALVRAKDKLARVFVCEARPLCEGRQLARQLAQHGVAVVLLTEAQIECRMPEVDFAWLGADTVLPSGDVWNKVGSAPLAALAREHGKAVWAITTRLKIARRPLPATPPEEGPPSEVWPDAPPGVTVSNRYFEVVPHRRITAWITEDADGWRPE